MRGDFFEYVPQFKIIIAGNNQPKLKSTDEAIRRRFNLIPFLATGTLSGPDFCFIFAPCGYDEPDILPS
jgi:hypothetical protein